MRGFWPALSTVICKYLQCRSAPLTLTLPVALQCGACWAFAATAGIESMQLIKLNKTWNLAEQHFIDCVNSALGYQSNGCAGGW